MFSPSIWWVIAGVLLMVCELVVPGLVLFFFGLGALITALVVWLVPVSTAGQLALFVIASLVALFGLRRVLKPVFTGKASMADSGSEGIMGQEAEVITKIGAGHAGKVELNGTRWKAESDETLEVGEVVTVVGHRSLTLQVKRK